jgi:hypothetical protein
MDALILLAVLVCPIVMGTMMFLMWRAMRGREGDRTAGDEAAPARTPTGDPGEEAGR